MKTLIEIKRDVWGKVRDFATVEDLTVSNTVEHLLTKALNSYGYVLGRSCEVNKGIASRSSPESISHMDEVLGGNSK